MLPRPQVSAFSVEEGEPPSRLHARCVRCGKDLVVVVCGGVRPHIGAVALGLNWPSPNDENRRSTTSSLLSVPGHKEENLAREGSLRLSRELGTSVVVTVGIHDDGITQEGIARYLHLFDRLIAEIAEAYGQGG